MNFTDFLSENMNVRKMKHEDIYEYTEMYHVIELMIDNMIEGEDEYTPGQDDDIIKAHKKIVKQLKVLKSDYSKLVSKFDH